MFCTACATFNPVAARRCEGCGAGLGAVSGPWQPESGTDRASARAGRRRWHPRRRLVRVLHLIPVVALLTVAGLGLERYREDRATLAAAYERAAEAEAAGRLDEAIVEYGRAGGYRDADARRAAAVAALTPYRTGYLDGIAALDSGRFDEAIALLVPIVRDLPDYEDAAERLAEARQRWYQALLVTAGEAETRGDWLAAETALAQLLAEDPDDPVLRERLAALRREHAPIVFTRDHQLLLIGPDLNDERLVTETVPVSWPSWSPDRTRIAFIAHEETVSANNRLFVVNADGTGLTELANQVMVGSSWPMWSPDGTRIAYTSQLAFDGPNGPGQFSVHVVDVASGGNVNVTVDHLRFATAPTWAPDGDRLAVIGLADRPQPRSASGRALGVEVYVLHLSRAAVENVGQGRFPDAAYLTWSPTDERLLIYSARERTYRTAASTAILQLDLATGTATTVQAGTQAVAPPVWSPDGSRFAFVEGETFVRVRETWGRGESWISLDYPVMGFLTWSPDGSSLVAPATDPKQPSFLIPLGGGLGQEEPVLLHYDVVLPNAGPPVWSPGRPAPVAAPPSVGGTAYDQG